MFFRDKTLFPLSFSPDKAVSKLDYKGFRLINKFPEFHYTINGIDIFELILPTADGKGLVRTFRIPDVKNRVWFNTDSQDGVNYISSHGIWQENRFRLSANEAKKFSITMHMKEGGLR